MEAEEFMQQAEQDAALSAFLRSVAQQAGQEIQAEQPGQYFTGAEALLGLAAYAFYRWLKEYFDQRRALNEVEVARQQAGLIHELIQDGFKTADAQAVAAALLQRLAARGQGDPLLDFAAKLLGKG